MFCPKCRSEYREGYTMCIDCEVDLVESLEDRAKILKNKERSQENIAFVPVLMIHKVQNIPVVKQILEERWIQYYFLESGDILNPNILMVREDQVPSVIELLKNYGVSYLMHTTI